MAYKWDKKPWKESTAKWRNRLVSKENDRDNSTHQVKKPFELSTKITLPIAELITRNAVFNHKGEQYKWTDDNVDGDMEIFDSTTTDMWTFRYEGKTLPNLVLEALNRATLTDFVGQKKFIDCGFFTALVYINFLREELGVKKFNALMYSSSTKNCDFTLDQSGVTGMKKETPKFFYYDKDKMDEVVTTTKESNALALSAPRGTILAMKALDESKSNDAYRRGENFIKVDTNLFAALPITFQKTNGFLSLSNLIKAVEDAAGGQTTFHIVLIQYMNYRI